MRDTRLRIKYALPDGRPIVVVVPHGKQPADVITLELRQDDPLWHKAQPSSTGSSRRVVHATLAQGL